MKPQILLLTSMIAIGAVSSACGQEKSLSQRIQEEADLRSFRRSLDRVPGAGLEDLLKSLATTIRSYHLNEAQLAGFGLGRFGELFRGAKHLEINPSEGVLERPGVTTATCHFQGRRQLVRIQPIVTWRVVQGRLTLQGIEPAVNPASTPILDKGLVPALRNKILEERVAPPSSRPKKSPADVGPRVATESESSVLVYKNRSSSSPVLYRARKSELVELGSLGGWKRVKSRLGSGWTKAKTDSSPTPSSPPAGYSRRDLEVLARIVKGETNLRVPREGRVAVAAVVLNRVRDRRWPNSIPGVAHQPKQFSCYNPRYRTQLYHGRIPSWAFAAAKAALRGEDPTRGATHYYNPFIVQPSWARRLKFICRIGTNRGNAHDFYK